MHVDSRRSNIELLRVFAMFLVLVVHADFFSLEDPDKDLLLYKPFLAVGQIFFESLSIICVNLFVLISGWFGIKATLKGFCNFVFQCLFFLIGSFIFFNYKDIGDVSFYVEAVKRCFFLSNWDWFIKSYICLYIFSPVINIFIGNSNKTQFRNFLICFFLFQTIYSWIANSAIYFQSGYSALSLIGLYSLARYIRLYPKKIVLLDKYLYFGTYVFITIFLTFIGVALPYFDATYIFGRMFTYVNPLVILSSLALLLYFAKMELKSHLINKIGISCFAVFLLHANPDFCNELYRPIVAGIVCQNSGFLVLLKLLIFLLAVYFLAILLDQFRLCLWKAISHRLFEA